MTFGSLFAGIGGLDLGLERAGMECRWQVEIDPFCRQVLQKHWPKVPKYGDITKLTGNELELVDFICGGFPCQPVSTAGKRLGETDERWLWPEFIRIIRVVRPARVLLENTPGLLVLGFGTVLGDLATSGYDAEWDCIPAAAVGAAHLRDRVFLMAHTLCSRSPQPEQTSSRQWSSGGGNATNCSDRTETLANVELQRLERDKCRVMAERESLARYATRCRSSFAGIANREDGASRSWVLRSVYGVPDRMDRIRSLGNAVVPQVAEWIGRRILEMEAK